MPHVGHSTPASQRRNPLPNRSVGGSELDMTWADGSPVFDCEEYSPSVADEPPIDDCHETESSGLKLETRGTTRQMVDGKCADGSLWKSATVFKFSIAAKLREVGETADADTLEDCHSSKIFAQCNGCSDVQVFRNRCDNFFCPECQPKLARRRQEGVSWWARQITQPKHVVLTVRNIPDLTKGHVLELKKWFTQLRHRRFTKNWRGGMYSVEVTNENKGWHLHLHILVDARWIDSGGLAREWESVNRGNGNIVKVKDCRNADYLREVTKYAVKGNELAKWTGTQIREFIAAFRGTKTFGVFGSLYGKRTEFSEWIKSLKGHKPKCRCGCDKVTFYSEHEWQCRDLVPTSLAKPRPPPGGHQAEFCPIMAASRQRFVL
jgi:hypothetical protein